MESYIELEWRKMSNKREFNIKHVDTGEHTHHKAPFCLPPTDFSFCLLNGLFAFRGLIVEDKASIFVDFFPPLSGQRVWGVVEGVEYCSILKSHRLSWH